MVLFLRSYGPVIILAWAFASAAPPSSAAQPISITPRFAAGEPLNRDEVLALELERPLGPSEGLAVFIGAVDVTALVDINATELRYTTDLLPLPSGDTEVIVYLISPDAGWQEVGRFPLRVRLAGGFDKALLDPGLTLGNKGQLAQGQFPAPADLLPRSTYQDFSGQFTIQSELAHPDWSVQAQASLLGVSYRNEALRFGQLQEDAPRVDLSSYTVQARRGMLGLQGGHISHGRHRHLINSFGSRGVTAGLDIPSRADLSVALMNGSSVVGWSNPLGINEPDHRIVSGTAGLELLRARPGGLRVEATVLSGSILPRVGFNQGGIPDAETSLGMGMRVLGATPGGRLRVEGAYAGSRYTNPVDPTLAQGANLVPVLTETRFAHFLDVSAGLLRNAKLTPSLPINLAAAYRRERVDPLYQTVASFVQADVLRNAVDLQGSLGPINAQFSYERSEDNLESVPSILKTLTRRQSVSAGVPLNSFAAAGTRLSQALLPTLSYSYNQTHQFGASIPEGGGFSPSHVPDQMSRIHNAGIDWRGSGWSFGYRFGASIQDNRQVDREGADFLNLTHGVSAGVAPFKMLSLNVDLNLDRAENKESSRIDYTRRIGARMSLRPTARLNLSSSFSPTHAFDHLNLSRRINTHATMEGSYAFQLDSGVPYPIRGQVFVRYARQSLNNRDATFGTDTESRTWTINSGVTVTLF